MSVIVELRNVSKNFHEPSSETEAVKNVSFSVNEGEFVSIVGPSGCGKSTLLSIISGLLKPSRGEVIINGLPCEESKDLIGYMLQKDHLFDWRTTFQNVIIGLEIQNKATKENLDYANQLLDRYGLGDFKKHYPSQLSGGMRQRGALIRTLVLRPEILLLDEPFSALDYQTRLYVCDEIASIIRSEKKTAILVTHDISEAISISDRVFVMSKRPSRLISSHEIRLTAKDKSALSAREAPEFRDYFNIIWKELDIHE